MDVQRVLDALFGEGILHFDRKIAPNEQRNDAVEVTNRLSARRDDELAYGDHKGLQPHLCSQGRS